MRVHNRYLKHELLKLFVHFQFDLIVHPLIILLMFSVTEAFIITHRNEPIEQSPFTSSTYICPFYSLCSPTPYPLI